MARFLHSLLIVGCLVILSSADTRKGSYTKLHHLHNEKVSHALQKQVGMELEASFNYLLMWSHFDREDVNRPGFAKFFKESAEEEFKHAQKFVRYMNKRGVSLHENHFVLNPLRTDKWDNGEAAMHDALNLEGWVTKAIKRMHAEAKDDGHLTNFLESEIWEDQVNDMRELTGYVHNLQNMTHKGHGAANMLAEYLFDQQLQRDKDD